MNDFPPEIIACYGTFNNSLSLFNCLFGYNGAIDPYPVLNLTRGDVEVIVFGNNSTQAEYYLDRAVSYGAIPEYRDDDGVIGGDDGGGGGVGDGVDPPVPPPEPAFNPSIALSLVLWLLSTSQ